MAQCLLSPCMVRLCSIPAQVEVRVRPWIKKARVAIAPSLLVDVLLQMDWLGADYELGLQLARQGLPQVV